MVPPAPLPAPRAQQPLAAPPPLPRSQTVPVLPINVQRANQDTLAAREVGFDPMMDDEESRSLRSEICYSPSWSDHGEKKKRKEKKKAEKEKKEIEKRMKKEEEKRKAADRKRLSKALPPAAMDTQKMPSGLRRNSIVSVFSSRPTSQDGSMRSSREERRISGFSFSSFKDKRSNSTPASSTELSPEAMEQLRVVSMVAPQLPDIPAIPRLGFHSRNGSSETDRTKSWGSGEAYQEKLAKYAQKTSKEASVKFNRPIDFTNKKVLEDFIAPVYIPRSSIPALSRSQTDPELLRFGNDPSAKGARQKPQPMNSDQTEDAQAVRRQEPAYQKAHQVKSTRPSLNGEDNRIESGMDKPRQQKSSVKSENPEDTKALSRQEMAHEKVQQAKQNRQLIKGGDSSIDGAIDRFGRVAATKFVDMPAIRNVQPINTLPTQLRPYPDGSSYVHKQRMYHQQLSISGFQEEEAVKKANEQIIEDKPLRTEVVHSQDTPNGSTDLVKHDPRKASIQSGGSSAKKETLQEQNDEHHSFLHDKRDSVMLCKTQVPVGHKADRVLVLSRRKNPPLLKEGATEGNSNSQEGHRSPSERPKSSGDLVLRFAKDVDADKARPESSNGKTNAQRESILEAPNVFSHSRTRTASSQLFNDDLSATKYSRPLPRSSTTPILITTKQSSPPPSADKNAAQFELKPPVIPLDNTTNRPSSAPKPIPELVIETPNGEGIVRKTSIKRPRSNPQLQSGPPLPSLDFLPQLKHQPLIKPKRGSPVRSSFMGPGTSTSIFPSSAPSNNDPSSSLTILPGSPLRSASPPTTDPQRQHRPSFPSSSRRRPNSPSSSSNTRSHSIDPASSHNLLRKMQIGEPLAKIFVICCKCKFWHDLPSELYKAMTLSEKLSLQVGGAGAGGEAMLDAAVKCPWCAHFMTSRCCEGWMTTLYMHQKMHP